MAVDTGSRGTSARAASGGSGRPDRGDAARSAVESDAAAASDRSAHGIALSTSIVLIVTGVAGLIAAFTLMLDELTVLKDPEAAKSLSCSLNAFVQCGKNLQSWQGHLFGFPNPMIGLMGLPLVILIGVGGLLGLRARRPFWWLASLGTFLALVFAAWLVTQSVFSLRTLCPWCCLVYAAVVPMALTMTLEVLRGSGRPALCTLGRRIYPWIAPITVGVLLVILLIAQTQIPVIQSLLGIPV